MPDPAYRYSAVVLEVEDGDGLKADVDLGFHAWIRDQPFRLLGVNAREKSEPGGMEAKANLAALLPPGTAVTLTSVKPDKYGGRMDAHVTLPDGTDLSSLLISTGWAAAWNGRGAKPLPPWPREAP